MNIGVSEASPRIEEEPVPSTRLFEVLPPNMDSDANAHTHTSRIQTKKERILFFAIEKG
jgi:hypothetical protein